MLRSAEPPAAGAACALPLLRAPPFPGRDATVTKTGARTPLSSDAVDRVFAAIREAQVGGCFWGTARDSDARVIVRARSTEETAHATATLPAAERAAVLWIAPEGSVTAGQIDPWSVLPGAALLVAHGDDEWVAFAVIAGVAVQLLSAGRFGAPGDDLAGLRATVAADIAGVDYRDPFTGHDSTIAATVALLAEWRRTLRANRQIVAACGFSWWKRREIAHFLWTPEHPLRFFRSEARALRYAARRGGMVAVWPSRIAGSMAAAAATQDVPLVRVEDGFVRSVGLGSNLVPPASVAVDRRGIHYDPGGPSDLEAMLADAPFPPALLDRAVRLRADILASGISKYGREAPPPARPVRAARRIVLVPGQVEDDMSVRLGGGGLSSNFELLRRVRALEPDAEIWFRPHPDVDAGHRTGAVRDADALGHADRIMRGGGMAALLEQVDAVHVLTSLTGFEALLRARAVTCHGLPFYAGWGLTSDLMPVPDRRGRRLTLDELVAGVLILYPRYLDPVTGLPCPPEVLIGRMRDGAARNRLGWITRLRQVQGRLFGRRA